MYQPFSGNEVCRRPVDQRTFHVAHKPSNGLNAARWEPARLMRYYQHPVLTIEQIIASVVLRHQWEVGQSAHDGRSAKSP
jgi:hypothetical protein